MELELEDGQVFVSPNRATLEGWLQRLSPDGDNTFAILTASNGDFIQTACEGDAFVLEKRTQDPQHHYRGVRHEGKAAHFTAAETAVAFHAFAYENPPTPDFLLWQNIDEEVGL